jgi:hypothetical protein
MRSGVAAALPIVLLLAGCDPKPDRPGNPYQPMFTASTATDDYCAVAVAFVDRDYVRDFLEPEITIIDDNSVGNRGPDDRPRSPEGTETLEKAEGWTATATVADRAPLPPACAAWAGTTTIQKFLDRLQAELTKVPPGLRVATVTRRFSVSSDDPKRKSAKGAETLGDVYTTYIFRLRPPHGAEARRGPEDSAATPQR